MFSHPVPNANPPPKPLVYLNVEITEAKGLPIEITLRVGYGDLVIWVSVFHI